MADSYEREGFARVLCRHRIVTPAQRRLALVRTALDPVVGHADRRPTHHRQIQGRYRLAHPTAILSRRHVQPQVQPVLDAPVLPFRSPHRRRSQCRARLGTDQGFGFVRQVFPATAQHRSLQTRRLRHARETRVSAVRSIRVSRRASRRPRLHSICSVISTGGERRARRHTSWSISFLACWSFEPCGARLPLRGRRIGCGCRWRLPRCTPCSTKRIRNGKRVDPPG